MRLETKEMMMFEGASIVAADLLNLYDLLIRHFQNHTFKIGEYIVESREDLLILTDKTFDEVEFSGSSPYQPPSEAFAELRFMWAGIAYVGATMIEHPGCIEFMRLCEAAFSRTGSRRTDNIPRGRKTKPEPISPQRPFRSSFDATEPMEHRRRNNRHFWDWVMDLTTQTTAAIIAGIVVAVVLVALGFAKYGG